MNSPLEYQNLNFDELSTEKPKKSKIISENGEKKEKKEKISAQLLFSCWLENAGDYMTKEGVIYKYTGTHWQAQKPSDIEKIAFKWLAEFQQDKATDKTATSCVASACLHLKQMPESSKNGNIVSIVCRNGTVRIEAEGVSLHPHNKSDYITYCLDCDYDESATCKMWRDFLQDAIPQGDVREYLQEYVGYTLMPDTRHQIALWCVGEAGTGKGTFCKVAAALHSRSGVVAMKINVGMLSGFYLSQLVGASLVVVDEVPPRIDEEQFKNLVSGDIASADRKYRDIVTFFPTAKWLIACNAIPNFTDQTQGLWRRTLLAPFENQPTKKIPLLPETIIDRELSGVLNWAINGLGRLLGRGSFPKLPDVMNARKNRAKIESDSVSAFIDDVEPVAATTKEGGMRKSLIYSVYSNWCGQNGLRPVSALKFWERIGKLYPQLAEFRRGEQRERCFPLLLPSPSD